MTKFRPLSPANAITHQSKNLARRPKTKAHLTTNIESIKIKDKQIL
jgi:hypothetical protein